MLDNLSIKSRLIGILGFLGLLLIAIGGLGLKGQNRAHVQSEMLLEEHVKPAILLGKIRLLQAENRSQILLALQHAPDSPFLAMHDHPVTFHTDQITKNAEEINRLMNEFQAVQMDDPTAKEMLAKFQTTREAYFKEGLAPAREAQLAGDFMKSNEVLLKKVNPLFKQTMEAGSALEDRIITEGGREQTESRKDFAFFRNLSIASTAVGLVLAVVCGLLLVRAIARPLQEAVQVFDQISRGNLNNTIHVHGDNEISRVMKALASMQADLKKIIGEIIHSANAISSRSESLLAEVDKVASHSRSQQDRVMQVSAAMEEVSVSVTEVANGSESAANAATDSMKLVQEGNSQMARSMDATNRVVGAVESSAQTIEQLNENIQKIGAITQVIKEIAEQTNLLALNAAIEAARAGEQGRGFAVVADEVRKLAERTSASTADISQMVETIQSTTGNAVRSMGQARHEVEGGMTYIRATGESLSQITEAARRVNEMAQHIASASKEQSAASEDVAKNMEQISVLIEENTVSIHEVEHASAELAKTANELRGLVKRFNFEGN
jgi:methyl-accepting chemotaxis protein